MSKITLSSHVQTAEYWTGVELGDSMILFDISFFFFLLGPLEFAQIKQKETTISLKTKAEWWMLLWPTSFLP